MAYTATPEDIQKIRYELNDNTVGLYILDDSTITYYLEKNEGSISRTSIDCARCILLRLSMDSADKVVDVISVKGSKAAEQYRLALELYLKSPSLNPLYNTVSGWAGGISRTEMLDNNLNPDNYYTDLAVPNNPFSV